MSGQKQPAEVTAAIKQMIEMIKKSHKDQATAKA